MVKGMHVDSFADVKHLAKTLEMQTQKRLDAKYGTKWSCKYMVNVKISPFAAPLNSRTLNYETHLVPATLTPDGWDAPGEYYTDADGLPQWLGPIVASYVGDFVNFRITNNGNLMQLTHFHGMLFKNSLIYNDGGVGFSSGTMEMDTSYNIQFVAEPAGTTFYHGHAMNAQASGNRGVHIVRKRPCNDPYA
jgi:FtsP/CotA-like multicopper oxidase with cupredoxin domain